MAFNIMDAIKNREQIVSPEVKSDGRIKIEYISVKNIIPAANSRNYYSTADIETLKAAIAVQGVKQNLIVKAIEGGKYELIAGERRWRASSALVGEGRDDCEFVPCAVEQPTDDLDERLLLTTTNSTARELTDYEKGLQVKEMDEILDEYERRGAIIEGPRRELIQKHLGLSSGQIGRYTAIHNNLSEDLLREYVKKEIGVSIAYELSKLPEGKQAEAYRLYLEQGGLSIKDTRQFQEVKEDLQALESKGQTRIDEFVEGGTLSESDTESDTPEEWFKEDEAEEEAATPGSMVNEHGIYKSQFIETTVIEIPKKIGNITLEMVYDPDDGLYHPGIDYWISKRKGGGACAPSKKRGFVNEEEAVRAAFSNLIEDEEVRKALKRAGYVKEEDYSESEAETPVTDIVNAQGVYLDQYITETKLDIPPNYSEITIKIAHDPIDRMHLIGSADIKEALLAGGYTNSRQISPVVEQVEGEAEQSESPNAWKDMTPCEQCRSANPWCGELHCCKTCEESCNARQICRIDDPPEKRQQEIDEWNRQTREIRDENNEIYQKAAQEERCYIEKRLEFLRSVKNITEKEGRDEKYLKILEQRAKIIENVLSFLSQ